MSKTTKQVPLGKKQEEVLNKAVSKIKDNVGYTWGPEVQMPMTGFEFMIAYNNMSEFLNSTISPISILKASEAFAMLRSVLEKAVEQGIATETETK